MRTSLLVQLLGLRKLTIESPTRAILDRLPEWTSRLISSLVELHFTVCYYDVDALIPTRVRSKIAAL